MKKYMNDLESWVKQVWLLTNLNDKKLVALDLVDHMAFKNKADHFRYQIQKAMNPARIDKLVTDIMLSGEGLKVR